MMIIRRFPHLQGTYNRRSHFHVSKESHRSTSSITRSFPILISALADTPMLSPHYCIPGHTSPDFSISEFISFQMNHRRMQIIFQKSHWIKKYNHNGASFYRGRAEHFERKFDLCICKGDRWVDRRRDYRSMNVSKVSRVSRHNGNI